MKNHAGSPCRVRRGWSDWGDSEGQAAEGGVRGVRMKPFLSSLQGQKHHHQPRWRGMDGTVVDVSEARCGQVWGLQFINTLTTRGVNAGIWWNREKRERKGYEGMTWKAPQNLGLFTCCFPLIIEIKTVTTINNSCCFHTFLSYDSLSFWSLFLSKFVSNHLHM